MAEVTTADYSGRRVPTGLSADLQKMSHIVRCSDVKKVHYRPSGVVDCVTTKSAQRVNQMVYNPKDMISAEHYNEEATGETFGNDESNLHALKGKGKGMGFEVQRFHKH